MLRRGIFLTFEGTEGAGKSTIIQLLAKKIRKLGNKVRITREPGGSALAEGIRELILNFPMNSLTELFLYEAARNEHIQRTILPALKRGETVLCDRFTDSSLAYQASARGLPWEGVKALNSVAAQGLKPDLSIFMDIAPALGLKRAKLKTRFEREGVQFQKRVRAGYLKAMREDPKRWVTVNSQNHNISENVKLIMRHIENKFLSPR